ncbi:response regulator transcription factor [Actinosynnema sp. CS-041913]|uniref:response regulator transcription factor n=1 Tax=Actinosynnema sp. CS-041913 TaxID=3239917 RepID=UPI003D8D196E
MSRKYLSRTGLLEVLGNVPDAVLVAQVDDLDAAREYCERGDTDLVLVDPAVVADHRDEVLWGDARTHPGEAVAALRAAVPRVSQLSPRELDVLRLLGHGLSNRAVAGALALSERTVKAHVAKILTKLGLESRLQAGLVALKYFAHFERGDGAAAAS